MLYYIYKIENLQNHKKYIGLTNNITRRRMRHFSDLARNCHDNSFLQKEYNIFGKDNFSFEVLFAEDVTIEEIGEKEKEFIKFYDSYCNGYNQNEGGNFGPTNGGSHLTKTDIFNILSILEFESKPGQVLADMYNVSRTTISRIKLGVNHNQYKEEYDALSFEQRKQLHDIFCETTNFYKTKTATTIIESKRQLTEEQVHLILLNEELKRPVTLASLQKRFNIKSSYTFYCIFDKKSYKDYCLSYQSLTDEQKLQLASLLRN